MNYIEIGLPHSDFVPVNRQFSPRRLVPLSGLGKKYLGLETLNKTEIDSLVTRLSQPKQWKKQNIKRTANDNVRFTGKKKLSSEDMKNMIDRLSKGSARNSENRKTKEDENNRGLQRACQGKIVPNKHQTNEMKDTNNQEKLHNNTPSYL